MNVFQDEIVVPDRYEALVQRTGENINQLVEPIETSLDDFDKVVRRMKTAGRGAFTVLRGDSGTGKSTFLHTIRFFRKKIQTVSVPSTVSIRPYLEANVKQNGVTLFVLEEREAVVSFSYEEIETWLHEINGFLRTNVGQESIVVWPCNTDTLLDRIEISARQIGGKALLGPGKGWLDFEGPAKTSFAKIAERTLALANQGASLSDVGLTAEQIDECVEDNDAIGDFFSDLHSKIEALQGNVAGLIKKEQCRLWVVVVAGNDASQDVAGLTRGSISAIDTERLMSATDANIVSELKAHPEQIGIVGTVLDAKITYLPVLAASSIIRAYANETLKVRLRSRSFALKPDKKSDAKKRLSQSDLAGLLEQKPTGVQPRGAKVGSESKAAFDKLCDVASNGDVLLNKCIGEALLDSGLIVSFTLEQDFGSGLTRRTDILCQTEFGELRIEVMWRKKTSRAEIANYTLTKVYNYAKAIGFMS